MLKIGHRGAKAYAPENSLDSFAKAVDMGVDMVEFDVRITKDKHPIVIHDNRLMRLANKWGKVNRLTLKQVRELKLVEGGGHIPTLAEVLEVIDGKVGINIELKSRRSAQIVVQTLRDYKMDMSSVMISSNYPQEIRKAEKLEPGIVTGLLFRSPNAVSLWLIIDFIALVLLPITKYYISWIVRRANADYLCIHRTLLTKKRFQLLKEQGIKVCVWTVDDERHIEQLRELGVDAIISNYPDRL